jgi:nitric oxide reductase NorD protein
MSVSDQAAKQALATMLRDEPELAGSLELIWRHAKRHLPGSTLISWLDVCGDLASTALGMSCTLAYLRNSPTCAAIVGADPTFALARSAIRLGLRVDSRAALALLLAAPKVARRLNRPAVFVEWLRVIEQLGELAPDSVALLLDRIDVILDRLDLRSFEAWALGTARSTADDPERRQRLFALLDLSARRALTAESSEVTFSDVERRLKAYLIALWGLRVPIRSTLADDGQPLRRASFDSGFIRMPAAFRGPSRSQATELFRASLAHIAAHLFFGGSKFRASGLKPLQVALVSLIEDARVEQRAFRVFPGLRRLWVPHHVAEPSAALIGPVLMARLARALIDPAYRDEDAWVQKGRALFFNERERWEDPSISRSIGGLLGNDLGQMRIQFNARTYVVEPAYRDDNLGLWDFGHDAASSAEADRIYEPVRIEQSNDDDAPHDREHRTQEDKGKPDRPNLARLVVEETEEETGIPVARYPEWDYLIGADRSDWVTLLEFSAAPGNLREVVDILEKYPVLANRITALIRSAKVSRPIRLRRQPEGDRLDLDACIAAAVSQRQGDVPDPRVYATLTRRHRDLSVLVLLDVSMSTNDIMRDSGETVLGIERDATALLAHAMEGLGDLFAIHAFCSNGRDEVRYYRLKDFAGPYDDVAKRRLAGVSGKLSTRIGAALRHAGRELARQHTHRRLLLIVTDGEPSDIDVGDRRYLVEDARKAVRSLMHMGIDVYCVGLDGQGDSYLTRIFERRNVLQIDRLERLPEKLPMLYFRLTA